MISICLISVGIVLSAIGRFAGASPRHILFDGLWNASFRYGDDFDNDFEENNTYHVSDASINSIDIDWISGRVTVIPYDGDDIVIREKNQRAKSMKRTAFVIESAETPWRSTIFARQQNLTLRAL